jgi:FHS family L-fucose permease-like MFS transporter
LVVVSGLGEDAKLGSAGLICAIGGGCLMPPLQALVMDGAGFVLGPLALSATRASFFLPVLCFVVIALYGLSAARNRGNQRGVPLVPNASEPLPRPQP